MPISLTGAQIIAAAEAYSGVPYNNTGPQTRATGLDCSGIVQRALRDLGVPASRDTYSQLADANSGRLGVNIGTNLAEAQPGDIIHEDGPDGPNSHEEIWLGGGMVFSEATFGEVAAIRKRSPYPIAGIVRYANAGPGAVNTIYPGGQVGAPAPTGLLSGVSPTNIVDKLFGMLQSWGIRAGLILLGGAFVVYGCVVALNKQQDVTDAVKMAPLLAE